jgi:4-hydroxybenzoate polyprenyltransferase
MKNLTTDSILVMLVFVFLINALFTTLGESRAHVAWFCFGFVFLWIIVLRASNKLNHRK